MKISRLFLMGLLLLSLTGCATYYQPSSEHPLEPIREFTSTSSVALINGQPSKEEVKFTSKHFAVLNSWTDVAISITERELKKRGLSVVKETPKSITMSIDSAKTHVGWVMISSQIVMSVKTSDGYSATYIGKDKSAMAGRPLNQMDRAMMRVVVEMLNDPPIVNFLTK
jgi:hypothetical protein